VRGSQSAQSVPQPGELLVHAAVVGSGLRGDLFGGWPSRSDARERRHGSWTALAHLEPREGNAERRVLLPGDGGQPPFQGQDHARGLVEPRLRVRPGPAAEGPPSRRAWRRATKCTARGHREEPIGWAVTVKDA